MAHFESSIPCAGWDKDELEDIKVKRGLIVQQGTDQKPEIRVALFRKVDDHASGTLEFDLQALAKLKGELSGSSTSSDYSLGMKDSEHVEAPHVTLEGTWKLVKVLDDRVAYSDLVETSWRCERDINTASIKTDHYPIGETFSRDRGLYDSDRIVSVASECKNGRTLWKVDFFNSDEQQTRGDWKSPFNEGLRSDVDIWNAQWKDCDPSDHARVAFSPLTVGSWKQMLYIRVFTVSKNPLYPAPDFYNEWEASNDVELKNAFQIFWLITQQKAKSMARP